MDLGFARVFYFAGIEQGLVAAGFACGYKIVGKS